MKFGVYRNIELQMEILHLRYIFHDGIQMTENKDGTWQRSFFEKENPSPKSMNQNHHIGPQAMGFLEGKTFYEESSKNAGEWS